ncbi:hypothetical protein ACFC18_34690 [Streptomyces sp. NPDC056121]|jgi:hypothetical protein|uniref:Uncharacterized protein n=2 Tax=Streptomyces TaxID=1883 RepID=A0AAU1UIH2_9ACTN|nr:MULTISPECIES: hypothetical protein [Streptomyces]WSE12835.1 hypothetical protein OG518_05670 [Streptomyces sp. NBC_01397]MCX4647866.1 hypothetical protein [Streptomyces sp. NBC_01446]MCX5079640.1 hypothetical protein [Streptomyces sp. NBC_00401]MCX5320444.1 hypothetical protein [Streptomyces sp. NBC_00120]MCX5434989.1 hypothetical protein [Streptomyces sp. NBC_00063]
MPEQELEVETRREPSVPLGVGVRRATLDDGRVVTIVCEAGLPQNEVNAIAARVAESSLRR